MSSHKKRSSPGQPGKPKTPLEKVQFRVGGVALFTYLVLSSHGHQVLHRRAGTALRDRPQKLASLHWGVAA